MSVFVYEDHSATPVGGVCIVTVRRGRLEVADLVKLKSGLWSLWRVVNPVWSSLELREIADKLDVLNSAIRDEVQVQLQGGDAQ